MITVETVKPYIAIARLNHWFKNVFVLPGIVVATFADNSLLTWHMFFNCLLSLLSMGLVSSSYYVLNEVLDAEQDALHPKKKFRPVPSGKVNRKIAYAEWLILAVMAFAIAAFVNTKVLLIIVSLWIMALLYNVRPIRLKDRVYLDVLSESVNNPLRLVLGWYATGVQALPPVSLVAAYWMLGAFFMAVKRFAELRRISDAEKAAQYRLSFRHYNAEKLLVCITYYAVAFGLCLGIFIVRYKMELLLSVPLIAGFIAWYIHLGFLVDSPTQNPEHLYKEKGFVAYAFLCLATMTWLMFANIPELQKMFSPTIPPQSQSH